MTGYLLKSILNLNLGLVQCWILFELSLRVDQSIKQTDILNAIVNESPKSTASAGAMENDKTESVIFYGRSLLAVGIAIETLALLIYFIVADMRLTAEVKQDKINEWLIAICVLFCVLGLLLIGNVVWLISRIKRKRD